MKRTLNENLFRYRKNKVPDVENAFRNATVMILSLGVSIKTLFIDPIVSRGISCNSFDFISLIALFFKKGCCDHKDTTILKF